MNSKSIMLALGGLITGCAIGFVAGYNVMKQKADQERADYISNQEKQEEDAKEPVKETSETKNEFSVFDPSKIKSNGPAKIATPEKDGINYSAYAKKVEELKYKAESESPKDDDETEEVDDKQDNIEPETETYAERVQRDNEEVSKEFEIYKQKKKKPFYILGNEPVDPEYPDIQYKKKTLLYFTMDDILSSEEGEILNDEEIVGSDLRKFGWYKNASDHVWVRNMDQEIDYNIEKQKTDYADLFGTDKLPDLDEET